MRRLPRLPGVAQSDPGLTCWLIFEQLEFLHTEGRLDQDAWSLVCALLREHQALIAAMRAREPN